MRLRRWVLTGLAVGALVLAGCSNVTPGTPMADPDQTGISTTTTTTTTRTTPAIPVPTEEPTTAAPGPPPEGLAATTCADYITMDDGTKRQVIDAIGQENELVALNPELWVGMAEAMCTFADKSTLVKDAVTGGGFG